MHLANANKCHFVVWTLKSIEVILVFRDPTWNLFLSQLESFFVEFYAANYFDKIKCLFSTRHTNYRLQFLYLF